ncbi:MAG: DUF3891 family protein [Balneolales bacterium]
MIVRDETSHNLLISQPAHAWISGQLAGQWGANGFTRPGPWDDLCFAVTNHDAGWVHWEMEPALNPNTGLPYDFKNIPIADHFRIWDEGPLKTELVNRYSALLVSRHVTGLSRMHDFSKDPGPIHKRARVFRNKQDELQKRLIGSMVNDSFYHRFISDDLLKTHQKLISVFDYLSLIICMGSISRETINNIPHQSGIAALTIAMGEQNTFVVNPWPFMEPEFNVRCDARQLTGKYTKQADLSLGIREADTVSFKAKLRKDLSL